MKRTPKMKNMETFEVLSPFSVPTDLGSQTSTSKVRDSLSHQRYNPPADLTFEVSVPHWIVPQQSFYNCFSGCSVSDRQCELKVSRGEYYTHEHISNSDVPVSPLKSVTNDDVHNYENYTAPCSDKGSLRECPVGVLKPEQTNKSFSDINIDNHSSHSDTGDGSKMKGTKREAIFKRLARRLGKALSGICSCGTSQISPDHIKSDSTEIYNACLTPRISHYSKDRREKMVMGDYITADEFPRDACFSSTVEGRGKKVFQSETEQFHTVIVEAPVTALTSLVKSIELPSPPLQVDSSGPGWTQRTSNCLPRFHSCPHVSLLTPFARFTPDITVDEPDETYRFQCSRPGLYQCTVTGLVFHMDGDGDVVYRVVPWNRRLLCQHHKRPAGPLFDISCAQKSVRQLHLPHCEIRPTAGPESLSVAHVNVDGIEFIVPHKTTETHVIINITSFSGFGNVKDEDSPPDPVQALVLLFYRPPADPDPESLLNVLLLPGNVVLRDVVRIRKKLVGDERYIEMSPQCKLAPKQKYTLSICPEDDSVLVQPREAEFDNENFDNYFPSFQVDLEQILRHIKLFLRDSSSSSSVWERRVCLSSSAVKKSCRQNGSDLPPNEKLLHIRSSLIDGISGPVLKSLLDRLLERKVMCDSEKESVDAIQTKREQARLVIDTVRQKGEAASSKLIEILCELDEFLCDHLGLI